MANRLLKEFRTLATAKQAIRQREEKLLAGLEETLGRLGYRLESISFDGGKPQSRRLTSRGQNTASRGSKSMALPGLEWVHEGRSMAARHPRGRDRETPCRTPSFTDSCWG
jgi:hypothetical protein